MKIDNKTYDILKWIALVALPAIEAFWLTLGNIWNFPYVVEIGATIAAVDVLLGSLLGISGIKYNKAPEDAQTTFNSDGIEEMMEVYDESQDIAAEE